MLRLFQRRGLLDDHTVADMLTWQGAGGFSLDASVRIPGSDPAGRERLLRHCARPLFALERLRVQRHTAAAGRDSGHSEIAVRQLLYHPPRPTPGGRTVVVLSPLEFLAALGRLIPPPRVHRHRYHGVLAPHARLRERVTAHGRGVGEDPETSTAASHDPDTDDPRATDSPERAAARSRWARLLART